MDEARAIEDLKTLIQDTEAKLSRYTAALGLLESGPTPPSPKKPAGKKGPREDPFKRKYKLPASVYAREEFKAVHPEGLAVGELRQRLAKRELNYDPQGVRVMVKKMEKKGILRRIDARPEEAIKFRWVLVK